MWPLPKAFISDILPASSQYIDSGSFIAYALDKTSQKLNIQIKLQ